MGTLGAPAGIQVQALDDEGLAVLDALRYMPRSSLHLARNMMQMAPGLADEYTQIMLVWYLAKVCIHPAPDDAALAVVLGYEVIVSRQVAPPPQWRTFERRRWQCL
jgi:hypothetical protein